MTDRPVADDAVPDGSPPPRDARELARWIAAFVVIAAFVALAALAIAGRSSLTISTPAGTTVRAPGPPPAVVPALGHRAPPLQPSATPPPGDPGGSPGAAVPPTPVPPPAPDGPADGGDTRPPCSALPLPPPEEIGGLQSLIRLLPLFGPFSPEAFAMLPGIEPAFELLGPLFPLFERGLEAGAPLLDAATPAAQQLGEAGFGVLAPLYGPHRGAILDAERQLAAYLEPLVASLAEAPGTECLIALEGVLASLVR